MYENFILPQNKLIALLIKMSPHVLKNLIASINVSVVKTVTNSRCVYRVVAQVNRSIYALNNSAGFE